MNEQIRTQIGFANGQTDVNASHASRTAPTVRDFSVVRSDSVPAYDDVAWGLLAAAIYNARHAGQPFRAWNEIAANEITRNFYLHAADQAMRAVFPTAGY